jgi:hypothetical protein
MQKVTMMTYGKRPQDHLGSKGLLLLAMIGGMVLSEHGIDCILIRLPRIVSNIPNPSLMASPTRAKPTRDSGTNPLTLARLTLTVDIPVSEDYFCRQSADRRVSFASFVSEGLLLADFPEK